MGGGEKVSFSLIGGIDFFFGTKIGKIVHCAQRKALSDIFLFIN